MKIMITHEEQIKRLKAAFLRYERSQEPKRFRRRTKAENDAVRERANESLQRYRAAVEDGVKKWERLVKMQEGINNGVLYSHQELMEKHSAGVLCSYYIFECNRCLLFKKRLCNRPPDKNTAFGLFLHSNDNNEKLTAARKILEVFREELRRVTEEEAGNAEERQG
jgi:hypothetical protein